MQGLKGKVAICTGSGRRQGLGAAILKAARGGRLRRGGLGPRHAGPLPFGGRHRRDRRDGGRGSRTPCHGSAGAGRALRRAQRSERAAADRADGGGVRAARHPGEQRRRRLHAEALRRGDPRGVAAGHGREPHGHLPVLEARRRGHARRRARRPHHQHREPGGQVGLPPPGGVRGVQARDGRLHALHRHRAGRRRHHGERRVPEPRHDRTRGEAERVLRQGAGPDAGGVPGRNAQADTPRQARPARRTPPLRSRSSPPTTPGTSRARP